MFSGVVAMCVNAGVDYVCLYVQRSHREGKLEPKNGSVFTQNGSVFAQNGSVFAQNGSVFSKNGSEFLAKNLVRR
jgi:hypothetical protein